MEPLSYEKRGYLTSDFRLFHLTDHNLDPLNYHYHTFHKIIILLAGRAGYSIEGKHYDLLPGDFVLVGQGSIHRPEVEKDTFYERMILYISPQYLDRFKTDDCDLSTCFRNAQEHFQYVYHSSPHDPIKPLLQSLELALQQDEFGAELLSHAVFLQLMVEFNRAAARNSHSSAASGDSKIVSILQYLNLHLTEPLSIDDLAARFYISKYHMMRRFKDETGYTIHSYVTEKRLLLARRLLQSGKLVSDVCYLAGYQDYSTFSRAYRKRFSVSPSTDQRKQQ